MILDIILKFRLRTNIYKIEGLAENYIRKTKTVEGVHP